MVEIFGLAIYSVQWLGVVLGVGAEVVLLCAHLIALHQHKPQWLESIPAVRAAQFAGLALIVLSGGAAIGYQFLVGATALLALPVFEFKWALIIALALAYFLEKRAVHGRAALEGFTGATWLALFLVHSIAPVAPWLDLGVAYAAWLIVFAVVWGAFVALMKFTGKTAFVMPAVKPVIKVVVPPPPPPPPPPALKPVIKPVVAAVVPKPVMPVIKPAPMPVVAAKKEEPAPIKIAPLPAIKKESFWHRLMALFAKKPAAVIAAPVVASAPVLKPVPQPPMPPVSKVFVPPPAPVAPKPAASVAPVPANLPAVEPLELMPPRAPVVVKAASAPQYIPDYDHMPGLRIMPQRPEDLHLQNRAPLVQAA